MKQDSEEEKIKELTERTWLRIKWVLYIGIAVIILIGIYRPTTTDDYNFWKVIASIGCGILVGGASLAAGGFLGFIFGIPSLLQNQNLTAAKPTTFKYNDNLVQISDWLTKIIVGVGLTQLDKIPPKVLALGYQLKDNFGGGTWGQNAALAIIFYFLLFGFLIIYFWTRTDFTTIMKKTDDDINQVKEENEKIKQENEDIKDQVIVSKTKENIKDNEYASDITSIYTLESNATPENKDELNKLKDLVTNALKTKPVTVKDDLQKNRWGGKQINNNKQIKAVVLPNKWQKFFDITIEISSVDGQPINLPAAIFVHDSYQLPDDVIYVKPDSVGIIKQTITAYEAFTIGALLSDGTELELDLNQQPGYPKEFYYQINP